MGGLSIWHLLIIGVVALPMIGCVYFVPSIVAAARKHAQLGPVILVNVLVGWSGIGWVGTLIWAIMGRAKDTQVNPIDSIR